MISFAKNKRFSNIIKGLCVVIIYFFVSFCGSFILDLFNLNFNNMTTLSKEFYSLTLEISMLTLFFIIFYNEFSNALVDLKKNHWKYFSKYFKYYLFALIIMMVSNVLIMALGGQMANNETAIRDNFEVAPIYTFCSAVFLAPILEETVFRLAFRSIIKNDVLFILFSGLIFGSLHLIAGISIMFLPLYLLSYSIFGLVFAYILTKTNNIFVSAGLHTMHNGILMSLQVILLLLK